MNFHIISIWDTTSSFFMQGKTTKIYLRLSLGEDIVISNQVLEDCRKELMRIVLYNGKAGKSQVSMIGRVRKTSFLKPALSSNLFSCFSRSFVEYLLIGSNAYINVIHPTSIPGQCICRFSLTNTYHVLSEKALGSRLVIHCPSSYWF